MAALLHPLPGVVAPNDGLIHSITADAAFDAWAVLTLARTNLATGHLTDAGLCLVFLAAQARTARAPVSRRIRRDLPGLIGLLAVACALASPTALGAPTEAVSA